ncbi:hypothetical protein [Mobiluncus curtisii]|uniref:hypothetical protein n=1 Tax=Mobiluncus curtisii TaxID=2051 RepID=UPI00146FDF2F|nr:hypothetical protein [Mobiluncus curtisii]NMW43749.1 hypothetical protein [Mobiluncus curtisii]NMW84052.1 hypothetical protein [Mobiluncus curtisii]NMW89771.1 hypothetical protein [Mobiluncus curtisii]NMW99131.1 hypothetical protein [Mobiluncus curtisii]NMX05623.1 hypothetical protein [Mobiluncus curtisii]
MVHTKSNGTPVFRSVSTGVPPEPTPLFNDSSEPAESTENVIDVPDEDTLTGEDVIDEVSGRSWDAERKRLRNEWVSWKAETTEVLNTSLSDARQAATDYTPKHEEVPAAESALTLKITVLGVVVVAVLALFAWFWPHPSSVRADHSLDLTPVPDLQVLPEAEPTPLPITSVTSISGLPDGYDHPELAGMAADGKPETSWRTAALRSAMLVGGRGYGLVINLGDSPVQVKKVVVSSASTGGTLELRQGNADNFRQATVLGSQPLSSTVTYHLARPVETNSLVLWCTEMPTSAGGEYRLNISEIQVIG